MRASSEKHRILPRDDEAPAFPGSQFIQREVVDDDDGREVVINDDDGDNEDDQSDDDNHRKTFLTKGDLSRMISSFLTTMSFSLKLRVKRKEENVKWK